MPEFIDLNDYADAHAQEGEVLSFDECDAEE